MFSNSSSRIFFPSSCWKSLNEKLIVGIFLSHLRASQECKAVAEQLPDVVQAKLEHCYPVNPDAPRQDTQVPSCEGLYHFRPEYTCSGKFHPAKIRVLGVKRCGWLCEREIGRHYFYLVCVAELLCKKLQQAG